MNQKPKHTETSPNSYDAVAYGYDYRYDDFGGSAQASQSAAWSRTLTEHRSLWITDADGDINQHLQYLPFGESFIDQRGSNDIRFKFTGKERDAETGFDYFGARYYNSDISVWLSVDPLSDEYPSTSSFMYVRGNPVMLIDPDGNSDGWVGTTDPIKKTTTWKWDAKITNKKQEKKLYSFIKKFDTWGYTHTCADWSRDAFYATTHIKFDVDDYFGYETPRELSKTIIKKKKKKNLKP